MLAVTRLVSSSGTKEASPLSVCSPRAAQALLGLLIRSQQRDRNSSSPAKRSCDEGATHVVPMEQGSAK